MTNKNLIVLSLGANLESPKEMIKKAIKEIRKIKDIGFLRASAIYLTQPQDGPPDQNWYHNCAILINSSLSALEILNKILEIEKQMGRVRIIKNGPRVIDIDIILYNDLIINEEDLIIPHPRMSERHFVLAPLVEILPHWLHPQLNKTAQELLNNLKNRRATNKKN